MEFNWLLENKGLLLNGLFGLEKENVRVTPTGKLALTPHPACFGDKTANPFITTDFSESQIEMITPPLPSIPAACDFIETLHDIVTESIGDELLWPQSLPPTLPNSEEIPVAQYENADQELEEYRHHIGRIYGKERQLISGIHFNVSFSEAFFDEAVKRANGAHTRAEIKELVYLKVMRNWMKHRWLYVWLFGETPIAKRGFHVQSLTTGEAQPMCCGASMSLRTSPLGYRNREAFFFDFSSLATYMSEVEALVEAGKLVATKELYLPIRIKCLPKDKGAPSYLEFRLIDLNPLEKNGISTHALYFVHMLMIYALLETETEPFDAEAQLCANRRQDYISCFGRRASDSFPPDLATQPTVAAEAEALILKMQTLLRPYGIWDNAIYQAAWNHLQTLVQTPDKRAGIAVFDGITAEGYIPFHLNLAKQYKQETLNEGYRFHGLEQLELSTQLLLKAALCRGVNFELLDATENFVRLYTNTHEEYVVQATKTRLDTYVTVLMMENKVVTKQLLHRAGIRVPLGNEYDTYEEALAAFDRYKGKATVIKPKSTNFGIGISILKENNSQADFETALEIALTHDRTVMLEPFIEGKEYRFWILNNRVEGILHRVPANVTGDGTSSISELIVRKNEDPLRGVGYRTPLEKIKQGREEALFLKQQGYDFDTVVPLNEIVYLRENSNISTGGDSIDFTDTMHPSYNILAQQAAQAMGAAITGVDMMISDITQPANDHNYAIIEMNFNPAIHIHCYPYKGKNRKLNYKLIEALGF